MWYLIKFQQYFIFKIKFILSFSIPALGRIPSSNELLVLASQSGASPWKLPGFPTLGMPDLNTLMASANPQQAAAQLASLYFGLPRTFIPSNVPPHLGPTDIPGPTRTGLPPNYSQLMASQALYATRLQLSRLYPGLRFHPYFQPRLVQPTPVAKATVDSNSDCDSMSPNL